MLLTFEFGSQPQKFDSPRAYLKGTLHSHDPCGEAGRPDFRLLVLQVQLGK